MDEKALADHLFSIANKRAEQAGRHLGEGADNDLRTLTAKGAAVLIEVKDLAERDRQIRKAEADLRRLIESAIDGAKELPDYPPDLLGERSYFPAKLRFCPCRPFC